MLSVLYDDAPITQYSPAISEVFVNQIKVSLSVGLPYPETTV